MSILALEIQIEISKFSFFTFLLSKKIAFSVQKQMAVVVAVLGFRLAASLKVEFVDRR